MTIKPRSITPYLWFADQAEEAAAFYVSLFAGSEIKDVLRQDGRVIVVSFRIADQDVIALNGGPDFKFTEAFSFFVSVDTQEEVDELWAKLTANGGEESMCGWLKDRYGLSWQIIPKALMEMLSDPDPAKAKRATEAMLQMRKIDIAGLRRAHEGG